MEATSLLANEELNKTKETVKRFTELTMLLHSKFTVKHFVSESVKRQNKSTCPLFIPTVSSLSLENYSLSIPSLPYDFCPYASTRVQQIELFYPI